MVARSQLFVSFLLIVLHTTSTAYASIHTDRFAIKKRFVLIIDSIPVNTETKKRKVKRKSNPVWYRKCLLGTDNKVVRCVTIFTKKFNMRNFHFLSYGVGPCGPVTRFLTNDGNYIVYINASLKRCK